MAEDKKNGEGGEGGEGGEDTAAKGGMTAAQVNAAITKALRAAEKRQSKAIQDAVVAALVAQGKAPADQGDEEEEEDEDGAGVPPGAPAKAAQAAPPPAAKGKSKEARALAKMRAELDAMKAAAEAEKAKAARAELRDKAREALEGLNVRKEALPLLVTYMLSEEGGQRIRRNADGTPVFVMGEGDDAEEYPLRDGIAAWGKTDEGKAYIAPRAAAGSAGGAPPTAPRAPGSPARNGAPADGTAAADQDVFNALFQHLGGTVVG